MPLDAQCTEQQNHCQTTHEEKDQWCSILHELQFGVIVPLRDNRKREIMKRTEVAVIDFPNTLSYTEF